MSNSEVIIDFKALPLWVQGQCFIRIKVKTENQKHRLMSEGLIKHGILNFFSICI